MNERRCCAKVYDPQGWHSYACTKPPKVERNGKWYCTIHDPEYVARKQAAMDARYDARAKLYAVAEQERKLEKTALKAVRSINPDNPLAVCENLGNLVEAARLLRDGGIWDSHVSLNQALAAIEQKERKDK